MEEKYRILIVDDEEDLCEILRYNLEGEGYFAEVAFSAEEALEKLSSGPFSLVLLDVMMEGMSGFQMAAKMRGEMKCEVPVIFLTAKDGENDMLTGFSIGADDYIAKPYSVKEVLARVRAVLRRTSGHAENHLQDHAAEKSAVHARIPHLSGDASSQDRIVLGNMVLHLAAQSVSVDGNPVRLTRKEYEILILLASFPGRVFSRETILRKVWKEDVYVLERTVDVHITRLRKKLEHFSLKILNRSSYGYTIG